MGGGGGWMVREIVMRTEFGQSYWIKIEEKTHIFGGSNTRLDTTRKWLNM